MVAHEGTLHPPSQENMLEPTVAVFKGTEGSQIHTILAFLVWIGSFHFIFGALLASFCFLPLSKLLMVLGFFAFFMVIPIDQNSKLGRKLASYIYKHGCGYFPVSLHVEDVKAFNPDQAYVLGFEPHSIYPVGVAALSEIAGFMPLPKLKVLGSSTIFCTPFLRHIWTWLGVSPATRKNFATLLASGYSCVIIPGGVQESVYMEHGSEVVFLKSRKGFVRMAMQTGSPLVPVFAFGQSYVYNWWKPGGKWFLQFARAIKYAPIVFWGVFGSPLPYRKPVDVVVGKPIHLKKNPSPTIEEVDDIHKQFIESLQDIFNRHKTRVGHDDLELKIL